MKATGFKGASNITEYQINRNGEIFDLVDAGVIKIEIVHAGKVLSSENGSIRFDSESIKVEWGAFDLSAGSHKPKFYAYRAGDLKGEVLFDSQIDLKIVTDERPE
jgi:hypothetical protein